MNFQHAGDGGLTEITSLFTDLTEPGTTWGGVSQESSNLGLGVY